MSLASSSNTKTSEKRKSRKQLFKYREMMKNAGDLLSKFELSETQKPTCLIDIKNSIFIASYNWRNSDKPMIFVPGTPIYFAL